MHQKLEHKIAIFMPIFFILNLPTSILCLLEVFIICTVHCVFLLFFAGANKYHFDTRGQTDDATDI